MGWFLIIVVIILAVILTWRFALQHPVLVEPPAGENSTNAVSDSPDLVQAMLLADTRGIIAGQAFRLGVLFRIKPGWHIYWQNPGDAGLATAVRFTLPAGFTTSALRWPIPRRFDDPGGITTYGYSDSVLLFTEVTPPGQLPQNTSAAVSAAASWLVCRDKCVPGSIQLQLTLPAADNAGAANTGAANTEIFTEWSGRLPATAHEQLADVQISPPLTANTDIGQFTVILRWKEIPPRIECFPAADENVVITNFSAPTHDNTTRISFAARLINDRQAKQIITLLIVTTDSAGLRRGVNIPVLIRDA